MSNKYKSSVKKSSSVLLLPIILILGLLPLIVQQKTYNAHLSKYSWFTAVNERTDLFLYHKAAFFILLSIFMCGFIIYKIVSEGKKIKFTTLFLPLGIYGLFALLSSIFSEYARFSFQGIYEHFESVFVLLGYCLTAYYTYLCVNTEEDIKKILRWWILGIIVISLIGLTQALYFDFYKTPIGQFLITFSNTKLDFNFEAGRVYMSLYNPNYVGTFVALVLPILLALSFYNKKKGHIAFLLILSAVLLFCLLGSQSRNGLIALGVALLFMLFFYRKEVLIHWKFVLPCFILFFGALIIFNQLNNNVLLNRLLTMFDHSYETPLLSDIQTYDDHITITYGGETLFVQFFTKEDTLLLTDENKEPVDFSLEETSATFTVNDPRFPNFTFLLAAIDETTYAMQLNANGSIWNFTNQTGDGKYYYFNDSGKYDTMHVAPTALPESFNSFGSGRGYIWSRTLPLLKNSMLLGSGADTFSLVFPQDDYVAKHNNKYQYTIITKPHNLFLQVAVQTGIPSLIALLVFYVIYFISCIRLYWKCDHSHFLTKIGLGIFIGSVGYMISGIANDSTITVAPIFWVLMGMGISVNHLIKKEQIQEL